MAAGSEADTIMSQRVLTEPALRRLAAIGELPPDWDTYGGLPPTPQALATARGLVELVTEHLAPVVGARGTPYSVAPIPDGGVHVEWRGARDTVEVWVSPGGEVGYLYVRPTATGEAHTEEDDVSWSKVLELVRRALEP
jgi:hypothetical protein